MIKFVVDECVSRSVFAWLKDHFDTLYVPDVMPGATDHEILNLAISEVRVIITRDKDFGDIIFRDKKQSMGVVLLRLQIKHPSSQLKVLQKILDEISGNFIVATDMSIKIIHLLVH